MIMPDQNVIVSNPRRDPLLVVNEIFGPTIQGEGKSIGTPTMFLRLGGCNLSCVWCDTAYSWDWTRYDPRTELHPMTIDQIMWRLANQPLKHLVITGGEPLLQQKHLFTLTQLLHKKGWFTEIETAGTIVPHTTELAKQFNVSPKLAHSGNPNHKRLNPIALETFVLSNRANFKFVVQDNGDWHEIDDLVSQFKLNPVYIMPEGTDTQVLDDRIHSIVKETIARGYILTPRLHIQLYGKKRAI